MTRDEAITITSMVLNGWAKPDWTDGQTEAYVNALVPHDAEAMTTAVFMAHRIIQFRPAFADLYGYYKAARADAASRQNTSLPPEKRNTLPLWVKRWVCARFLYKKFGREQDMRVFPEQREPYPDEMIMPADEWVNEANRITEREALRAVAP